MINAPAVAQALLLQAPFETADLQMAPPWGFHTYINLENWFWVPESQWHPISLTENLGPASVTLTARPSRLEIETGDGAPPTNCYDPGRPWREGMTDEAKTTCSYAYRESSRVNGAGNYDEDGRFAVVGRIYYHVAWTCSGACSSFGGSMGENPGPDSATHPVDVRQRQTVVTQ